MVVVFGAYWVFGVVPDGDEHCFSPVRVHPSSKCGQWLIGPDEEMVPSAPAPPDLRPIDRAYPRGIDQGRGEVARAGVS